jgi:glucosamine--fructose-6-phosphate aminotransferase (isomerizing)
MMDRPEPVVRCSRCVLPSSLPGSEFNDQGECAWCQHGFPAYTPLGEEPFHDLLRRYRRPRAPADCLVGISGGKDSSYVTLQLTRRFGMRVEAFTYVHDAMSPFALANAREVARSLGVKHHLVSLPGRAHVNTFAAFFEAWMGSGDLLAAAAACSACKHIHHLGSRIASARGIPMVVWADCALENPSFLNPAARARRVSNYRGLRDLGGRVSRQFLRNGHFRRALVKHGGTCLLGCLSLRPEGTYLRLRYPRLRHLHYFDYCAWDRPAIIAALQSETPWVIPESVTDDWHSDCQLHVLKEYMYQSMFGAADSDAHLSNQIRHGLITREQGWRTLVRTKEHQAEELEEALARLGLQHLWPRLDPSCFRITEEAAV